MEFPGISFPLGIFLAGDNEEAVLERKEKKLRNQSDYSDFTAIIFLNLSPEMFPSTYTLFSDVYIILFINLPLRYFITLCLIFHHTFHNPMYLMELFCLLLRSLVSCGERRNIRHGKRRMNYLHDCYEIIKKNNWKMKTQIRMKLLV